MNKFKGILLFLVLFAALFSSRAQSIKILYSSGFEVSIPNNTKFTFQGKDGEKYSGNIYIYNDSQFAFYNYFNEIGKDTFYLDFVNAVISTDGANKLRIRPGLTALAILAYPVTLVAIPVLIVKLIINKNRKNWVDRSGFSISIQIPKEGQDL